MFVVDYDEGGDCEVDGLDCCCGDEGNGDVELGGLHDLVAR